MYIISFSYYLLSLESKLPYLLETQFTFFIHKEAVFSFNIRISLRPPGPKQER
jgi:hypothetical protein